MLTLFYDKHKYKLSNTIQNNTFMFKIIFKKCFFSGVTKKQCIVKWNDFTVELD